MGGRRVCEGAREFVFEFEDEVGGFVLFCFVFFLFLFYFLFFSFLFFSFLFFSFFFFLFLISPFFFCRNFLYVFLRQISQCLNSKWRIFVWDM